MLSTNWRRTLYFGGLSLVILAGCARGLSGNDIGPEDAPKKMVLAVYSTEYKDKIAEGLVDRFKSTVKITQVSVRDLKRVDPKDFDVLVIVDQLMAWQIFNFDSIGFIRNLESPDERRKVVLYLTAGSPKDGYKFQGIDAMTGATAVNREGEAIDMISKRVNLLLVNP